MSRIRDLLRTENLASNFASKDYCEKQSKDGLKDNIKNILKDSVNDSVKDALDGMGQATNFADKNYPSKLKRLIDLVKGKNIFLGAHWDADGVTSGAIIFHLISPYVKSIRTLSKGHVFSIDESDIPEEIRSEIDYVITVDIKPGDIDPAKVIYIDHHPNQPDYLYSLYDPNSQSCSLLIWEQLLKDSKFGMHPYFIFLTLVGYFGDGGKKEDIPAELWIRAKDTLGNLMTERPSYFGGGTYLGVERYVSLCNIGKRAMWSGDIPMKLLMSTKDVGTIVSGDHHIIEELEMYRRELKELYKQNPPMRTIKGIDFATIECDKNVQGVLCARLIKKRPIIILNKLNSHMIGSMRVPDNFDFDAGTFLEKVGKDIPEFKGGGHEKAAGFTFGKEFLDKFYDALDNFVH